MQKFLGISSNAKTNLGLDPYADSALTPSVDWPLLSTSVMAGSSCRHWRFDTERWLGKVLV